MSLTGMYNCILPRAKDLIDLVHVTLQEDCSYMWRWLDRASLHKSILLFSDSELISLLLYYLFDLKWLE